MSALTLTESVALTMSSREIAELTGKEHKNVIRDIRAMLDSLAEGDGSVLSHVAETKDARGYTAEIALPKDLTLTLVAGYNVKLRKRIIDRWLELEAQQPAAPAIPQTLPEALRLAAEAIEERDRLALAHKASSEALAIAAPKAQALDRIAADDKALTVTQASKVLGVKRETLTNWLSANGWMYRQNGSWVAYQQHIQNGRLLYKEARYTDEQTGQEVYRPYCHITQKGLAKLAEVFSREVAHG